MREIKQGERKNEREEPRYNANSVNYYNSNIINSSYADTNKFSVTTGGPTSVTMYQYKYPGSRTLSTTVSKADTYYWLASRSLSFNAGRLDYYSRLVKAGAPAGDSYLYISNGSAGINAYGVRPVVYLKSDIQLEYDADTGYTIK